VAQTTVFPEKASKDGGEDKLDEAPTKPETKEVVATKDNTDTPTSGGRRLEGTGTGAAAGADTGSGTDAAKDGSKAEKDGSVDSAPAPSSTGDKTKIDDKKKSSESATATNNKAAPKAEPATPAAPETKEVII